jgi:broad specificity phosphatase PhoE
MKLLGVAFICGILLISTAQVFSQNKLIILVRHGEKAVLESDDDPDPELSDAGNQRALRFAKVIGKYRPGAFYSTDYRRTRETILPLAQKRHKEIKIYDPQNPQALIDEIMASKTKRFVIAGHSNTIPGLANLIGKKELFRNLNESEFGAIYLIRIKEGKIKHIKILPY